MNKRLFVAGLPFSSSENDIKDHFGVAGSITLVQIIIDKFSGRSKGFGFIEFETEAEAEKAIQMFNETDFKGRKIIVAEAKPQEKREFKPREFSNNRKPFRDNKSRFSKFDRNSSGRGGYKN